MLAAQLKNINSSLEKEILYSEANATPFLKWAGGKSQLLNKIDKHLPDKIKNGGIKKYYEPFLGGGAVFFYLAQKYDIQSCYLSDVNKDLVLAYRTIQGYVAPLILMLQSIQDEYFALSSENQEKYFYEIRTKFNESNNLVNLNEPDLNWIIRASQIIFLNRTCFNGLFRVNSRGLFNVPFGRYKNPVICNDKNLHSVSRLLKNVVIHHGDFASFNSEIGDDAFIYFDPPYRPLSASSSFTSYAKSTFDDSEQIRLAKLYHTLNDRGALLMLSNSDTDDDFFVSNYKGFNIHRAPARRNINSNALGRGEVSELIITNY